MDRLSIVSSGSLGSDYQGLATQKRRAGRSPEEEFPLRQAPAEPEAQDQAASQAETQAPVQAASASAVAQDLGQEVRPFSAIEASLALDELLPQIATASPWKLAEVQPVAERSLVSRSYV